MKIACKQIASAMEAVLKKEINKARKKKPTIATFVIGNSTDQLSWVKSKKKLANKLGINFELIHLKKVPSFENFMNAIKKRSLDPGVNAITIEQPLPAQISTESIYEYIPLEKEIEAHARKTPYLPPIGLAILTVLKSVFGKSRSKKDFFINLKKDRLFFKKTFRNKKVVLIGRGTVDNQPIGKTLSDFKINYISISFQTPQPEFYLKEADVIITRAGKKVIASGVLKPGAVIIAVGSKGKGDKYHDDFDEKEIKETAGFYTPPKEGINPIDFLYLYKNLLDALKLQ
jgi:methylenetetrahydrofolate dehydrogenase (NADP+)/methenyltetrahydrofolate cyclohydrolase